MASVIERAGKKPIGPDADRRPQAGDGLQQLAVPEQGVGVGRVQRLGAGGEVEHPRAAVGDDERHGQGREHATVAEPQRKNWK